MKTNIKINKKALLNISKVLFAFVLTVSCDSYDEEPPLENSLSSVTDYVIPPGKPLSDAERKIVNERNKEYREALGIKN